jgi:uncharacterized protein (TIGR03435 family)
LSCYGRPDYKTLVIHSLADEGSVFDGRNHVARCRLVASTSRYSFSSGFDQTQRLQRTWFFGGERGSIHGDKLPVADFHSERIPLQPAQLIGGPDWLDDEHYDIVAKSPVRLTSDTLREMEQALLVDRFQLKTHRESRELPIYALVLARSDRKLGPGMAVTPNDCAPGSVPRPATATADPERPRCNWFSRTGRFYSGGITMATFAEALSLSVDRKVVDHSGLTGYYEFELSFSPDFGAPGGPLPPGVAPPPSGPDLGSLYTALQEQLGLKLESTRGTVEVIVIDQIARPTPD